MSGVKGNSGESHMRQFQAAGVPGPSSMAALTRPLPQLVASTSAYAQSPPGTAPQGGWGEDSKRLKTSGFSAREHHVAH